MSVYDVLLGTPTTKEQMRWQGVADALTGGVISRYHISKEQQARQDRIMGLYGLSWSDMKYPWLTSYGSSVGQYYSSQTSSAISGITRLYRNL